MRRELKIEKYQVSKIKFLVQSSKFRVPSLKNERNGEPGNGSNGETVNDETAEPEKRQKRSNGENQ